MTIMIMMAFMTRIMIIKDIVKSLINIVKID